MSSGGPLGGGGGGGGHSEAEEDPVVSAVDFRCVRTFYVQLRDGEFSVQILSRFWLRVVVITTARGFTADFILFCTQCPSFNAAYTV